MRYRYLFFLAALLSCASDDDPAPEVCDKAYRPVCGSDGKTYGNACDARNAGLTVWSEGECPK